MPEGLRPREDFVDKSGILGGDILQGCGELIQVLNDIQGAPSGRVQKAAVVCHLKVLVLLIDAKFTIEIMVGSSRPVAHIKVNAAVNGVALPFPFSRHPAGMPGMFEYLALVAVHLGICPAG
jgi:hypothetical protein